METKICSGKHGCGRELPIERFKIFKNYTVKGELRTGRVNTCHVCLNKRSRSINSEEKKIKSKKYRERLEVRKRMKQSLSKYQQTDKGKVAKKRASTNSKKRHGHIYLERARERRNTLSDSYMKELLSEMDIHDPSPEIIQAKRLQLLLYREIKTIKDEQQRHVNN